MWVLILGVGADLEPLTVATPRLKRPSILCFDGRSEGFLILTLNPVILNSCWERRPTGFKQPSPSTPAIHTRSLECRVTSYRRWTYGGMVRNHRLSKAATISDYTSRLQGSWALATTYSWAYVPILITRVTYILEPSSGIPQTL